MDNGLSAPLSIGLGLLVATMTMVTAGSVGVAGYLLGQQASAKQRSSTADGATNSSGSALEEESYSPRRLRIPSGSAGQDVKISDKKAIEIPLTTKMAQTINRGRQGITNILRRMDDRLVVVVGPCSIHDVEAAMDYAKRLLTLKKELENDLLIVMRVYFEKPRTTVGWKGLINDPGSQRHVQHQQGSSRGSSASRRHQRAWLPAGCEFLDTMSPQFICDLVSWGAIGARTTECQLHRELTSGLSMPIGFKNGTGGSLQLAVDAVVAARHPHCFLSVSSQGLAAIVNTAGNDCCHVILRGGKSGPNYEKKHVDEASALMLKANLMDNVMVDCSHGNSRKDHKNQVSVAADIASQIRAGDDRLVGVMLESNIKEGNQSLIPGQPLEYGKSVTDACMSWETTQEVLRDLAAAVRERRNQVSK
ncbi:hypothetical protein PINS_up002606 [Pythium insidiosum]|nr:hypothetical protein PINS_up002606 [Pythium insidiosum]